ncbi:UxaA family hydrolase [Clostridium sp. AM58-1XD]|uniref:UxaA family hydrolase n=1 Tax=Clostridium sp. AM58-1XD TaxID=2292307 RepID=UPI000E497EE3|nr:UxaA family hydrolase [Clostridium sp. AM58-1XD]RGY98372.1 galactonate dehydratase [Clostridium sp. AM58-1XD]
MHFMGYRRPDGQVGVRNYIGVIPSVFCANKVAELIASQVEGAVCLRHPVGCSQIGEDLEITARTLIGMGCNPNLGAVLIVGLGCERFTAKEFLDGVRKTGKPAEMVLIQEEGDTLKAVEKGVRIVKGFAEELNAMDREPCPVSKLMIGLNCGGTDATSGIAANPAVGAMSDKVTENGGSVLLSEITELLGTEHILASRAVNEEVSQKIRDCIAKTERHLSEISTVKKFENRSALISTGNFDGGVSSVVEKALGGVHKSGSSQFRDVIDYSVPPSDGQKGLFLMDAPTGQDGDVVTGEVGCGAQIIVFTTGRGTPTGFPFVPVVKVTGNEEVFEKMKENIDLCVGGIISKGETIAQEGNRIFEYLLSVADGKKKTKAEILGHDELFCITRHNV